MLRRMRREDKGPMVDLVQQLREVRYKKFSPESLQVMVLWGADEIERLRAHVASLELKLQLAVRSPAEVLIAAELKER